LRGILSQITNNTPTTGSVTQCKLLVRRVELWDWCAEYLWNSCIWVH
jgi:hypothetical protein